MESGGPKIGKETRFGGVARLSIWSLIWSPHPSCKRNQIEMRDYMDRRVTPLHWVVCSESFIIPESFIFLARLVTKIFLYFEKNLRSTNERSVCCRTLHYQCKSVSSLRKLQKWYKQNDSTGNVSLYRAIGWDFNRLTSPVQSSGKYHNKSKWFQ